MILTVINDRSSFGLSSLVDAESPSFVGAGAL